MLRAHPECFITPSGLCEGIPRHATHYHSLLSLSIMHGITLIVAPCPSIIPKLHRLALANSGMGLLNMNNGPNNRNVQQVPASGVTLLMAYTLSSAFTCYYGLTGKRMNLWAFPPFILIRQSADSAQCELLCLKIMKITVHVIKDYGYTSTLSNMVPLMLNLHIH